MGRKRHTGTRFYRTERRSSIPRPRVREGEHKRYKAHNAIINVKHSTVRVGVAPTSTPGWGVGGMGHIKGEHFDTPADFCSKPISL